MTRIVFFGTPDFAVPFLSALINDKELEVALVVTQSAKPQGRKQLLIPSPVELEAVKHGIPVTAPGNLKDENFNHMLRTLNPDLFVVFAYGKILPAATLAIPKLGAINVHPSLLPKWRGPTPKQAAIAARENETGISIIVMDEKMDHGPILRQIRFPLASNATYKALEAQVADVGPPLLVEAIRDLLSGSTGTPQNDTEATFCKLLSKQDAKVNWTESAETIDAKRRAYERFPGIFTHFGSSTVRILDTRLAEMTLTPGEILVENGRLFIGTGSTALEILSLQPAGKKPMSTSAFLNGNPSLPKSI